MERRCGEATSFTLEYWELPRERDDSFRVFFRAADLKFARSNKELNRFAGTPRRMNEMPRRKFESEFRGGFSGLRESSGETPDNAIRSLELQVTCA